jgi:predicted O-methyltransferase YrrM
MTTERIAHKLNLHRSDTVGNRADLAGLCDSRGLKVAVEVGVDRGLFAVEFLSRWRGEMLYCVDSWEPYPQMPWHRDGDLLMAAVLLAPYARRVRLIRGNSCDVARQLGLVDFVYIDANHEFEPAMQDFEAWWPMVRPGGVMAGDDYDQEHPGVMQAVAAFAAAHHLNDVYLTTDYNRPPSWFFPK